MKIFWLQITAKHAYHDVNKLKLIFLCNVNNGRYEQHMTLDWRMFTWNAYCLGMDLLKQKIPLSWSTDLKGIPQKILLTLFMYKLFTRKLVLRCFFWVSDSVTSKKPIPKVQELCFKPTKVCFRKLRSRSKTGIWPSPPIEFRRKLFYCDVSSILPISRPFFLP